MLRGCIGRLQFMNETEAYQKLQELLTLAESLLESGHYSSEEIQDEIRQRIGE